MNAYVTVFPQERLMSTLSSVFGGFNKPPTIPPERSFPMKPRKQPPVVRRPEALPAGAYEPGEKVKYAGLLDAEIVEIDAIKNRVKVKHRGVSIWDYAGMVEKKLAKEPVQ